MHWNQLAGHFQMQAGLMKGFANGSLWLNEGKHEEIASISGKIFSVWIFPDSGSVSSSGTILPG